MSGKTRSADRWIAGAIVLAVALGVTGVASAAGGGGGNPMRDLIWNAVNFTLLLVVLFVVARKPALAFFADRREQVGNDVANAKQLLDNAEESHNEWQRKLVELEEELDQIRRSARNRAEQERETILAEARASAERIQSDAVAAVDQELRRAQSELRNEASELALELAGQLIQNNITDSDRERLMDEFISGVERPEAGR